MLFKDCLPGTIVRFKDEPNDHFVVLEKVSKFFSPDGDYDSHWAMPEGPKGLSYMGRLPAALSEVEVISLPVNIQ